MILCQSHRADHRLADRFVPTSPQSATTFEAKVGGPVFLPRRRLSDFARSLLEGAVGEESRASDAELLRIAV